MNDDELLRYSRHILLSEIGIEGQEKLLRSRVVIVGAGGLGCSAAAFLASSGVGHVCLIDDDVVDLTNLQRQIAHTTSRVGQSKVSSLADFIQSINSNVCTHQYPQKCTSELLGKLLSTDGGVQVVLDCTDNFETRHMINAVCAAHKTPLVSGSALKMDGQLTCFDTRLDDSPCYACLFPPEDAPVEDSCATMGVFAPLVGIIGAAQAAQALNFIMQTGQPLIGRLSLFNATQFKWSEIIYKKNPNCSVCGECAGLSK